MGLAAGGGRARAGALRLGDGGTNEPGGGGGPEREANIEKPQRNNVDSIRFGAWNMHVAFCGGTLSETLRDEARETPIRHDRVEAYVWTADVTVVSELSAGAMAGATPGLSWQVEGNRTATWWDPRRDPCTAPHHARLLHDIGHRRNVLLRSFGTV